MKIIVMVLALCMGFAVGLPFGSARINDEASIVAAKVEAIMKTCLVETDFGEKPLIPHGVHEGWETFKHNEKCVLTCALKKENMLDENGRIRLMDLQKDSFPNGISKKEAREMNRCSTLVNGSEGSEGCEIGFLFFKCMFPK